METIETIVDYVCLGATCIASAYVICKLKLYEVLNPSAYKIYFKKNKDLEKNENGLGKN